MHTTKKAIKLVKEKVKNGRKKSSITIYDKIIQLLKGIELTIIEHSPTYTSQESEADRGEDISIGGKALVIKVDAMFGLYVLSADRVIDNKKLKDDFKAKKIRFATNEELDALTWLPSGSIPPFGLPIFELNLYVDESILENEYIAFNAGSLSKSIKMKVRDYIKVAKPTIMSFSVKST